MAGQMSVLGSMATRGLLAELAATWPGRPRVESTGGVDAVRRVRSGEAIDVVVLGGGVMRSLVAEGSLLPGSLAGIAVSGIALAVREGEPAPDLRDAEAVKRTLESAGRIGYSTGPSGEHLLLLLERWDLLDTLGPRLVRASPGVPVGRLLAANKVDLAVQQRSELMGLPGVAIVGPLPSPIQSHTVFTAGVARTAALPDEARRFISRLLSPATVEAKRRHGMEPA